VTAPLGVGFLGAGPVTQAIHLPALARLTDLFAIRAVMDIDADRAAAVARRVGARAVTSVEDLLGDDAVDVVGVCSPHLFHADHVIAACQAGKRAILCEKPFATDIAAARRTAATAAETGVPVLVGAMHAYDPGWLAFLAEWGPVGGSARHLRCSAVLPPNTRFEDFATEVDRPDTPATAATPSPSDLLRGAVLGLAIHDLPLIRAFLAITDTIVVHEARLLSPLGYVIVFSCGDQVVELHAHVSDNWNPNWVLEVYADERVGSVDFTPSYVQAGSAVATIRHAHQQVRSARAAHNGYIGEWRHLSAVAKGTVPRYPVDALVADLAFALDLSERAAALLSRPGSENAPWRHSA
jgi:myo-inositol 2-dehydrogenase/D-chiro-inositol 1-dehydrogenase